MLALLDAAYFERQVIDPLTDELRWDFIVCANQQRDVLHEARTRESLQNATSRFWPAPSALVPTRRESSALRHCHHRGQRRHGHAISHRCQTRTRNCILAFARAILLHCRIHRENRASPHRAYDRWQRRSPATGIMEASIRRGRPAINASTKQKPSAHGPLPSKKGKFHRHTLRRFSLQDPNVLARDSCA